MSDALFNVLNAIKHLNDEQIIALKSHLQVLEEDKAFKELSICQTRQLEVGRQKQQSCPHCLSEAIIRWGSYKNRPRLKCKNCNRTFNPLTGTAWHYIHHHDKFKAYIRCMTEGKSLRACRKEVGICLQTSFCWRHKLLKAIESVEKTWLKKVIQADETFFLKSFKGQKHLEAQQGRKARKRGGTAQKRGISDEQVCVMAACDQQANMLLKVAGFGRLDKKMVEQTLATQVRKQRTHRAILVTDRHPSYKQMVKQKKLVHQTVFAQKKQYRNPEGFHINGVNAIHSRLKMWIANFKGVATKYLQNYLNYFRLWDKFYDFKERFQLFFNKSVVDNQVFTTYERIGRTT